MITGNKSILEGTVDLSHLGITFSSKPTLVGGLAIECDKVLLRHISKQGLC